MNVKSFYKNIFVALEWRFKGCLSDYGVFVQVSMKQGYTGLLGGLFGKLKAVDGKGKRKLKLKFENGN